MTVYLYERARARPQHTLFGLRKSSAALHRSQDCTKSTMSPKKCVFGCEGKITLLSKEPSGAERFVLTHYIDALLIFVIKITIESDSCNLFFIG